MLPFEVIVPYFIACCVLAIVPGPDNIFVLTQSALHGKKAGLLVVLGLCTGLLGHTAAVSFGVAVIFQTSQIAYFGLKIIGAAYLVYLAWGAFRAGASDLSHEGLSLTARQLYFRGIVMNITNPKVLIFFLAFLPQFTDPKYGEISFQMIQLGFYFILSTILVFSAVALLAGTLGEFLKRSQKAQRILNWVAGLVFIALAIKLMI